jgi:hypothetical protein
MLKRFILLFLAAMLTGSTISLLTACQTTKGSSTFDGTWHLCKDSEGKQVVGLYEDDLDRLREVLVRCDYK